MEESCASVLTGLLPTLNSCPVVSPLGSRLSSGQYQSAVQAASELAASSRVGTVLLTLTDEGTGVAAEPLARDVTGAANGPCISSWLAPILRSASISRAPPSSVFRISSTNLDLQFPLRVANAPPDQGLRQRFRTSGNQGKVHELLPHALELALLLWRVTRFWCCLVPASLITVFHLPLSFGRGMEGPGRGHVKGNTALL